jgi:predicted nucleotidyltransferase
MNAGVKTKHDVVAMLRRNRDPIRALGVKRLGLFGSFVRDQQGPESDVDLLVEFEPGGKTFDNFMALSFLLEDLLQRRVELVTSESLSPYLRPRIMHEVEDALAA